MSLGSTVALGTERAVEPVQGMHRAIVGRWFAALNPVGTPIRWVHDAISSVVYGSIRLTGTVVGIGLDAGMAVEQGTTDSVQAYVNGLWGDTLGRHEDRLGISMGIRDSRGVPVTVGPGLGAAFPATTGRLVVLVHGLMETEQCWHGADTDPGLAQALEDHPDLTPIPIRYNTGLRVSDNGSRLASLLEEVHAHWPVPVQSIALVGHSMGGLVIRSACAAAHTVGQRWIDDVEQVVTLGSPHRGAPLEKLTNMVAWALSAVAETRSLADSLNARSVGIKDLRFGAIVEEDWTGTDPDALLTNTVGEHSLPAGINHHFVAGVITTDPAHPVGVMMGDLLVRAASSTGGRRLEPTTAVIIGGTHHFSLLQQPAVMDYLMKWLEPPT